MLALVDKLYHTRIWWQTQTHTYIMTNVTTHIYNDKLYHTHILWQTLSHTHMTTNSIAHTLYTDIWQTLTHTHSMTKTTAHIHYIQAYEMRGGGLGSRPKKMCGERLGDGVEYHLWALRPVVKYHLRRGVGLIQFLENGTRPQPPTSLWDAHHYTQ